MMGSSSGSLGSQEAQGTALGFKVADPRVRSLLAGFGIMSVQQMPDEHGETAGGPQPESPAGTDRSSPSVWGGEGALHLGAHSTQSARDSGHSLTTAFSSSSDYHYSVSEAQPESGMSGTGLESGVYNLTSATVGDIHRQLVQLQSERQHDSRREARHQSPHHAAEGTVPRQADPQQPRHHSLPRGRVLLPSPLAPAQEPEPLLAAHYRHQSSPHDVSQPTASLLPQPPAAPHHAQHPHERTPSSPGVQHVSVLHVQAQQSLPNTQGPTSAANLDVSPAHAGGGVGRGGGGHSVGGFGTLGEDDLDRIAADLDQAMMLQSQRYAGLSLSLSLTFALSLPLSLSLARSLSLSRSLCSLCPALSLLCVCV